MLGFMVALEMDTMASIFVGLVTVGAPAIYLRSEAPTTDSEALRHPIRMAERTIPRTTKGAIDRAATLRLAHEAMTSSKLVGGYLWMGALIAAPLFLAAGVWNVVAPLSSTVDRIGGALVATGGAITLYVALVLLLPRMNEIQQQRRGTGPP